MVTLARRVLAVLVGVLVVTAPMTTTAAAGIASTPTSADGPSAVEEDPTNDTRTPPANASAFAYRVAAFERLQQATNRSQKRRPKLTRLREDLNGTFQYHRDRNRVGDRAVFRMDRRVAAALAEHHPRAAEWLVDADQRLATTAVGDAERVLATLSNRSASFDRAQAAESIENAQRALQKADRLHEKGNGPAAIAHYRQAWTHARAAIDAMDAGVGPTVTVTNRSDPVRSGSANYTIRGTVFAVQPGEVDAVTVLVNGEPREVRIRPETVPGTTRPFAATVRLDGRVANLTVVAEDPEDSQSGRSERAPGAQSKGARGKQNGGKEKNRGSGNDHESGQDDHGTDPYGWANQTDRAVLFLDGDGLPDRYEQNRTDTDSLNPDSDSAETATDEAGDGTHDGLEDYDGDGLVTLREREVGTDPLDSDTDDDRLSDQAELVWTDTSPLAADSDGDGVSDAREDPDDDALVNVDEVANDADPHEADTDDDGLGDSAELDVGTEPHVFDTDADGLGDDAELSDPFNTDPLDPDTDGDGTLDGNETYTSETANESVGAAVSLTGEGNVAGGVRVTNETRPRFDATAGAAARAGSIVHVEAEREFETANLSLQYDASEVADESDLSVFRYDESLGIFVPVDSTVDAANDTVTTQTTHFSTFTVLSVEEWASSFEPLPSKWTVDDGLTDLAAWGCTGDCRTKAGTAVVQSQAPSEDDDDGGSGGGDPGDDPDDGDPCTSDNTGAPGGGCLPPDDDPCTADNIGPPGGCSLNASSNVTTDANLEPADNTGGGSGGTLTVSTLSRTVAVPPGADTVRVAVTVTVSADSPNATARVVAEGDQESVMLLQASGSGSAAGPTTVQKSVSGIVTDTLTVKASTENNATVRLDRVRVLVDQDGDSLADPVEAVDCLQTEAGCVDLDRTASDTDGDELADDEELGERVHQQLGGYEISYFALSSKPDAVHSDGDGIDDFTETRGWQVNVTEAESGEPLRWKNSSSETMHVESDPLAVHSDDDGISDAVEKERLHTDPQREVTYAVTRRHQRQVVDELYGQWKEYYDGGATTTAQYVEDSARAMGLLDADERGKALGTMELTDATDDFDFVTADDGDYVFRALDDRKRTDTWFSNRRELGSTDPWDPDTDNDGLTDGQEVEGVTKVVYEYPRGIEMLTVRPDPAHTYYTSPKEPDTDGDGYWDGWIGVYGVENSRNVILYNQHARMGNGIEGDEVVEEQIGIHPIADAPSARGAAVFDGKTKYHSNIHLGELRWGSNPDQRKDVPDTSITVEVDYYSNAEYRPALAVLENVSTNYRLYDLNITFTVDDELTKSDLEDPSAFDDDLPPTSRDDANDIEDRFHDNTSKLYLFITTEGAEMPSNPLINFKNSGGTTSSAGGPEFPLMHFGVLIFAGDQSGEHLELKFKKVIMHEMGHVMGAGRVDDKEISGYTREEIYSGHTDDPTKERLQSGHIGWSVMRSGWDDFRRDDILIRNPLSRHYFVFSIEELSTVETHNITSIE